MPSKVCPEAALLSMNSSSNTKFWSRVPSFVSTIDESVGCSGVVHVASVTAFEIDPHKIVTPSIAFLKNALAAAAKEKSVKRFVLTSSSAAVSQNQMKEAYDLTADMWADWAVQEAWAPPPYAMERARANYYASKVQTEQKLWQYVKEKKLHFVVNSVLPDFIIGLGIEPKKQGYVSSMGLFKQMFDNSGDVWRSFGPQWCVDAVDTALLHIAGLVCPGTKNERIFAYAHRKTWTDFIERLEKMYPNHNFPGKCPMCLTVRERNISC
jgi:nucleoside-diphosphate-sugar epimerase